MLIPESMTVTFLIGAVTGMVFTVLAVFLLGLLYRLDCEHFCADEIEFEKPKRKLSLIVKKGG